MPVGASLAVQRLLSWLTHGLTHGRGWTHTNEHECHKQHLAHWESHDVFVDGASGRAHCSADGYTLHSALVSASCLNALGSVAWPVVSPSPQNHRELSGSEASSDTISGLVAQISTVIVMSKHGHASRSMNVVVSKATGSRRELTDYSCMKMQRDASCMLLLLWCPAAHTCTTAGKGGMLHGDITTMHRWWLWVGLRMRNN